MLTLTKEVLLSVISAEATTWLENILFVHESNWSIYYFPQQDLCREKFDGPIHKANNIARDVSPMRIKFRCASLELLHSRFSIKRPLFLHYCHYWWQLTPHY